MSTKLEVVYRWPDGREEVRYSRPINSDDAKRFTDEVRELQERDGKECPYSIRFV